MGRKYFDTSWDFRTADTKRHTHGMHNYPAIMIPQVASRLIDKYYNNARLLFDPYCGSGTSLVESLLRGIDSIGTDLNPLARLLSKVKTTVVDITKLDKYLKKYSDISFGNSFGVPIDSNHELPNFTNIDFWFDKKVQEKLAFIKYFIANIRDIKIRGIFNVAFSETVRESSWTRNGEFKLYRITEKMMQVFNPDVLLIMERKLMECRRGLAELLKDRKGNAVARVYDFNTVYGIPDNIIKEETVDIVVTSPPYGDSRTTVAYGQFSRLSNEWLGFRDANQVDKRLMGGKRLSTSKKFECEVLDEAIDRISAKDAMRVKDVVGFYLDYKKSIDNIAPLIKRGGYSCYVVGNRIVKGIQLPTDEITKKFFEINGFKHIETVIRNIPNKRMPSKNSPTNVPGELGSTMTNEYIVVMEKKV